MTPSQAQISDAAHKIGRRLGTDVYGVFEDQKNLIDVAIVGAIALALMKDYISGFADFKTLGQAHRSYLDGLIKRIRSGNVTAEDKSPASMQADVDTFVQISAADAGSETRRVAALEGLTASLKELGLSEPDARTCADDIARIVSGLLPAK